MSEDTSAVVSRKDKRAKRDAERASKFRKSGKKDKPAPADLPGDDQENSAEQAASAQTKPSPDEKAVSDTQVQSKKRKRAAVTQEPDAQDQSAKQESKTKTTTSKKRQKTADSDTGDAAGKKRFILFVGNLPYSTTDQSLEKHFEKLQPFSLRHRTDPATRKSKGFAFLEFENYDRLKTCLKLYHHSYFDPEDPNAKDPDEDPTQNSRMKKRAKGRKINVMLSAGGGGNTEARKEKIKVKNERLDGQRARRQEAERKAKEKERRKKSGAAVEVKGKQLEDAGPAEEEAMGGMHPSRLARM
ncbi:hypothetical protein AMS68_004818 [Peltaster fructicola]|uniref:RRM domain-containing protein n=1 Tax=Peltaster fructicola TaxID=286661 RepID=A0A6H0XXB8_9PEZI|nr:hypothetical protein AMS68_004818 [Peltaster fructicola]